MSEQLAAAAAAIGLPEDLTRRSAEARAAADGVSIDEVLAAWAGGGAVPASSAQAPQETSSSEPEEPATPEPDVEEPDVAPSVSTSPAIASPVAVSGAAPPTPASVRGAGALDYDAVVTVQTAGISERTAPVTPRWISLMFLVVPLVGLVYLISFAQGPNCGVGGQLTVDRLTGAVENCDGTEFIAAGGAGGLDVRGIIVEGAALYVAAPGNCVSCHGSEGQGGTGPALSGGSVLSTFAACSDHLEWVELATTGFQSAGRATYGDTDKAVGGGGIMSGFSTQLTADELVAVVMYERVQFGRQDPNDAAADCGLVEIPDEDETAALDR